MAFSIFNNVAVTATSTVVPATSLCLEDELAYYGDDAEKAKRLASLSGLSTRRIAPEGVTASDLCLQAAQNLLARTGTDKAEIAALIFVSHSPDYLLPASAAILQHRLGLSADCATMDMNVGCAGFVKGLWISAGLVASGACSKVLLLVGDTPNRFLNPANRVTSPVFGDAGTATLLEYKKDTSSMSFLLGSDGGKHEALVIPGGGSRIPQRSDEDANAAFNRKVLDTKGNPWTLGGYGQIWMDGMGIYSFGVSVIPPHIRRHMALINQEISSLDALLLHQANKIIIEGIAKKVGMDLQKTPSRVLGKYGNLGSSSIPAVIGDTFAHSEVEENSSRADMKGNSFGTDSDVGFEPPPALQRDKVMLCGFGAGLAWGSCFLSLRQTLVLGVQNYIQAEQIPTRDELIASWHKKFEANS